MHVVVLLLAILACCAQASKLLFIFPGFAHSHHTVGYSLAKELASRGHEVTFVSPMPEKKPIKNIKNVQLVGIFEKAQEMKKGNLFDFGNTPALVTIPILGGMGLMLAEETLKDEAMQNILKSEASFDLVITESFICDALHGIAHHYKVPSVLLTTIVPTIWTNHIVGVPDMPSIAPHMALSFSGDKMPFWGRVLNTVVCLYQKLYDHLYFYPKQNQILKTYFPDAPNIYDLVYNTSLMFVNSDISFNKPLLVSPNMIEIGGYHVDPPQILPEDLQKIMDESKDGVIYFSMGSNLKSSQLQPEVKDGIMKVFSKLKQTVLWKFEEDLPNRPSNLIIRNWFPQNDILAHPNVKLFITHGGLLSTIESVFHGKPMVGIPVFGDQALNIANAVNIGYAVELPLNQLSEATFSEAVKEAITNPKYTQIAKQRSQIMDDRKVKPKDKAAYWVDYVIRHKGAPHLKSPGLHLTGYEFYMVDVILFIALIMSFIFAMFYKIISWVRRRNNKPPKSTKKKVKQT